MRRKSNGTDEGFGPIALATAVLAALIASFAVSVEGSVALATTITGWL